MSMLAPLAVVALVVAGITLIFYRFGVFDDGSPPAGRGSYSNEPRQEHDARHSRTFDFGEFPCSKGEPHDKPKWPCAVKVNGYEIGIESASVCGRCLEAFFAKYAASCASCGRPILPGMSVGQAWVGAPQPFTHMTLDCTASGGLYCGVWGQGRLVTLHEIDPKTYPSGTPNAMAHVFASGKPLFSKIG